MDSLGGAPFDASALSRLSDRDKQELQQFVANESQKARIQSCMHFVPLPLLYPLSLHPVALSTTASVRWSCGKHRLPNSYASLLHRVFFIQMYTS
jgi:hypothetical protein